MKLNKEQLDAFSMEISTFGNIPICSQYCGIGCVFCKVHTDSYLGQQLTIQRFYEFFIIRFRIKSVFIFLIDICRNFVIQHIFCYTIL